MRQHKLIPKGGAWVKINQIIPTEKPVHRFGIYYAVPTGKYFWKDKLHISTNMVETELTRGIPWLLKTFGTVDNLKKSIANYKRNPHHDFTEQEKAKLEELERLNKLESVYSIEMQVKIITEYGSICIQPHEYVIVQESDLKQYFEYAKNGHAFINYLSKSKQLKGKVAEQVFYLRTRGISFANAIQMCIGEVKTSNLLYLYMHPGYVEHFTREPQFTQYVNKHLTHMFQHKLIDEGTAYLNQVKQIEGYENFKFEE